MADLVDALSVSPGYKEDLDAWTQFQALALRRLAAGGVNAPVDLLNVADEIESLGNGDRRQIGNRLQTIVEHVLKLQRSPRATRAVGGLSPSCDPGSVSNDCSPKARA